MRRADGWLFRGGMPQTRASKVCIVDDDTRIRQALSEALSPLYTRVEAYASGPEFLGRYVEDIPACLILDVRMPGMSGLAVQSELAERHFRIPVLFLTACNEVSVAVRAMKGGAIDFIRKPYDVNEVIESVDEGLAIARWDFAHDAARRAFEANLMKLTSRERDVLSHVLLGQPSKVIGSELGISQKKVEVHRSNLLQKMRVASMAELLALILRFPEVSQKVDRCRADGDGSSLWSTRSPHRGFRVHGQRPAHVRAGGAFPVDAMPVRL